MKPIFLPLPGSEPMAKAMARAVGGRLGKVEFRHFPDGESYLRIKSAVEGCPVVVVACLDRPDAKFLPLIFLADTARDLGARSVGLLCPYLPYMRQDKRFRQGEAITSTSFAALLSNAFDWLVTVDPHLHRYRSLAEIYNIPTRVVHAAPGIAQWIHKNIRAPILIGPDEESAQWVQSIAKLANAPSAILRKERKGDRTVKVSKLALDEYASRTPVLMDDVISTARTMIETVRQVRKNSRYAPYCVAIHGVFADTAYADLRQAGAAIIATCNTLLHSSNEIDVTSLMASAIDEMVTRNNRRRR